MARLKISKFDVINTMILIMIAVICILPFHYVFVTSLSNPQLVKEGHISLLPKGFSLKAYMIILQQPKFFNAFKITIYRTVVGVVLNLLLQCMMGYALSKKYLKTREFFIKFIVFTLLFNAGMIPTYLIVRYTGLIDTLWALVVPDAISAWNVLVLITFFSGIPESIEESAKIDGANEIIIFFKLILPLSIPAVSTIGLFIAVRHWNALMDGVLYINKSSLKPLQVYLMEIIMRSQAHDSRNIAEDALPSLSFQTTAIFVSTLPILVVYPFIQKYFTKGIMIGAIKG